MDARAEAADPTVEAQRIADRAVHHFVEGSSNCAEGVVAAFCEQEGTDPAVHVAQAAAFGGGIGSLGHLCGALAGGLMVVGRCSVERGLRKAEIRAQAQALYHGFEQAFGTVECRTLTGHDCEASQGAGWDLRHCEKYIRYVVGHAQEALADAGPGGPAQRRSREPPPQPA